MTEDNYESKEEQQEPERAQKIKSHQNTRVPKNALEGNV